MFAFNSGYGYDALEYLVIGRSLVDGYHLYDFIPSKSFGLYGLVAGLLKTGLPLGHFSLSVVVAGLFCANVVAAGMVARAVFGRRAAWISGGLIALCSVFMEMNYLEPESLVAITGLLAFLAVLRGLEDQGAGPWLLAGAWVGIGTWFKSVALFYLAGIVVFLVLPPRTQHMRRAILLLTGFLLAVTLPAAWFASQGRLADHLQWTYLFPLLRRRADLSLLWKLYTKLLWFLVLLAGTVLLVVRRRRILAEPAVKLALCMGCVSLLALFKQQASHYVFPAAVLLSLVVARAVDANLPDRLGERVPALAGLAAAAAVLLGASAWLYRPGAFKLFTGVRDFSGEQAVAHFIQERVRPEQRALFVKNSMLFYWISHRYPNLPILTLDVQETWWLRNQPDRLIRALADPALALVEFDSAAPGYQDHAFMSDPRDRQLMSQFRSDLERHFVLADTNSSPYVFWQRQHTKP